MSARHSDLHQSITDRIIAAIAAGAGPWQMPWRTTGLNRRPVNVATANPYRGVNILVLWAERQLQGYSSPTWGTYRQWAAHGCQVRKGEKASTIVFYKPVPAQSDDNSPNDADTLKRLIARASSVFNADQVDGFHPIAAPPAPDPVQLISTAERFIAGTGAIITHGGDRAAYNPRTDQIRLPHREAFIGSATSSATETYYATILHELVHWTGPKHRLDRDLTGRFGSHAYAMEELVAELGTAFICADLQLSDEPRPDHAAYLASWLQVLRADRRAIFTAASLAAKAADFLHSTAGSGREAAQEKTPSLTH